MKITAVIIDDEKHCIKTLQFLLKTHCSNIEIIGTAENALDGAKMVIDLQPQLIFLDIQMPYKSGIDMLADMPNIQSRVIFTTAYDTFAIRAIRLNALDYLLKPIDSEELIQAVEKFIQHPQYTQIDQTKEAAKQIKNKVSDVIAVNSIYGITFIKMNEIICLEADNSYTHIYTIDGDKKTVSKTLLYFEELLDDTFFRCHKSFIINLREVKSFVKGDASEIIMSNQQTVFLSRNKREEFLGLFNK